MMTRVIEKGISKTQLATAKLITKTKVIVTLVTAKGIRKSAAKEVPPPTQKIPGTVDARG